MSCSLSVLTVFNWANAAEYDQNDSTKSFRQTQEIQNYSQPLKLIHSLSWSADLQNNSQFSSTNESDDCDQFFKEDLNYFEAKNIKKIIINSENNIFIRDSLPTKQND